MPLYQDAGSAAPLPLNLSDFTANSAIGTANATVDLQINQITLNQTTASISLTVPAVTTTTDYKVIDFQNIGTVSVILSFFGGASSALPAQGTIRAAWNGVNWAIVNNAVTNAEFSESILTAAQGIGGSTVATSALLQAFSIPSAGTWEITTRYAFNASAFTGNPHNATIGLFLAATPTVVITGTERNVSRYAAPASPQPSVEQSTKTHVFTFVATGPTNLQIRSWSSTSTGGAFQPSEPVNYGSSGVSWKKISGTVPFNLQATPPQGFALLYTGTPTLPPGVVFTSGNSALRAGNLTTVQGAGQLSITLKAGKTYEVSAALLIQNYGAANGNFPSASFNICSGLTTTPLPSSIPGVAVLGNLQSVPAIESTLVGGARPASAIVTVGATDLVINLATGVHNGVGGTDLSAVNFGYSGYFQAIEIGMTGVVIAGTIGLDTTGTGLATVTGSTLKLPTPDYFNGNDAVAGSVNIANGAAAKTLTLGSSNTTSSTLIQSGSGNTTIQSSGSVNISTNSSTGAVNLGTGAAARTVTVGSVTGASNLNLQSGTGTLNIQSTGVGAILIGTNTSTGPINIGTGVTARPINIGNNVSGTLLNINSHNGMNLSEAGTASPLVIRASNFRVNIQDSSGSLFMGNATGASATELLSGTGGFKAETTGAGVISIGTNASTGAINVGTGSQGFVNIGTGGVAKAVTISNTVGSSGVNISTGTGGVVIRTTGTGGINIGDGGSTGGLFLGTSGAKQIDIGSSAANITLRSNADMIFGGTTGTSFRPETDNTKNLGISTHRWGSIFASNGVIQTSDRTLKDNITHLTPAKAWGLIDRINTYNYTWKDGDDKRVKSGVMAQELLEFAPEKVWGDKEGQYGVNYADMVAELICVVQDLKSRVSLLES